ncbi:hypothetical protein F5Y10DRAFT_261610 [Nemania abortiva]|nr:hypothetical protein F5Y10DRAFT_261610 [Nemania abortiva]
MAASSSLRATIPDFGLVRDATVWEPKDTAFIDSYIVPADPDKSPGFHHTSAPEWRSFKITLPRSSTKSSRGPKSPKLLNGYAVSPTHHAYATFCVELTSPDGARHTDMRYRDMVVDNYISACASAPTPEPVAKLRWLGVANIINACSRSTFAQIFQLTGHDILRPSSVEIRPVIDLSDANAGAGRLRNLLLNDPFTRGVLALLHHRARDVGHSFVKRFIFISRGYEGHEHSGDPSPLELRLDLVVELARPGDDDEIANSTNI